MVVVRGRGGKTAASANAEYLVQRGLLLLVVGVLPHLDEENVVSRTAKEEPVQPGCGGVCGEEGRLGRRRHMEGRAISLL
jgi:hypothetical protein